MTHAKVFRTLVKDVPFLLKSSPGGNLIDDADWVDGATAPQWPTVVWRTATGGGGSDVTSSFSKNIASDSLPSGAIKHPDTAKGIWRKSIGVYRHRVQPSASLAFGDYYLTVEYNPGTGSSYSEEHVYTLAAPGDVSFTDLVFDSVTTEDITDGIETALTPEQIQPLLDLAVIAAQGFLEDECRIDPDSLTELPNTIRVAIILYAQGLVFTLDASSGYLSTLSDIQEGSERLRFANRVTAADYEAKFEKLMHRYCRAHSEGRKPLIKAITSDVGHSVN